MNPKIQEILKVLGHNGIIPEEVTIILTGWEGTRCNDLTVLNDRGLTFADIADIIEQIWNCQ